MSQERTGVASFKDSPLTLVGPQLNVGDQAPDFKLNKSLGEIVSLEDFAGKVKLISVIPSIDTGVCEAQTRRFNEEAAKLGDNVAILTVSADLPFAQHVGVVQKALMMSFYCPITKITTSALPTEY